MTEHVFTVAGADCVAGDLILNGVVVGQYRNGQFIMTEAGVAKAKELEVVEEPPKASARKKAPKAAEPAADEIEVPSIELPDAA